MSAFSTLPRFFLSAEAERQFVAEWKKDHDYPPFRNTIDSADDEINYLQRDVHGNVIDIEGYFGEGPDWMDALLHECRAGSGYTVYADDGKERVVWDGEALDRESPYELYDEELAVELRRRLPDLVSQFCDSPAFSIAVDQIRAGDRPAKDVLLECLTVFLSPPKQLEVQS